jgi:hypothetical protein
MQRITNRGDRKRSEIGRFRAILVVAVLVVAGALSQAHGGKDKNSDPIPYETMRVEGPILHEQGVSVTGQLKSLAFFVALKRKRTSTGFEFREKSHVVTEFPEELQVEIDIDGSRLTSPSIDNFVKVDFRADWKRGGALRPIASLTSESGQRPFLETTVGIWHLLTIQDHHVPLTD